MKALYEKIKGELKKNGVLLLTDPTLPSLTSIVAGEPVSGSWWGHPLGNLMYNLSNAFMEEENVLTVKLLNKKLTFVEKRLWDALFAIGSGQAEWQLRKLSAAQRGLLKRVHARGAVRADDPVLRKSPAEVGKLAAKLEERLLLTSESLHTISGKHVRLLKTWESAMKGKGHRPKKWSAERAAMVFIGLGENLSKKYGTEVWLPWE